MVDRTRENKLRFMYDTYKMIFPHNQVDTGFLEQHFNSWWANTRNSGGYCIRAAMMQLLSTHHQFITVPIRGPGCTLSPNLLLIQMDKRLGCPYSVNKQLTTAQLLSSYTSSMVVLCGSVSDYLELTPEREWTTHTGN